MMAFMMASATSGVIGQSSEKSRSFLSFMMLMASFHACRSRRFQPLASWGLVSRFVAILGVASDPHIYVLILFVRYFSYSTGIPWACVINWVLLSITIWIICFLPSRPGYPLSQKCKLCS